MLPTRFYRFFAAQYFSPVLSKLLLSVTLTFSMSLFATVAQAQEKQNNSSTPAPSLSHCPQASPYGTELTSLATQLLQTTNWTEDKTKLFEFLSLKLGPQLAAYFNSSPYPTINERAKLAKVPILMYHDILPKKQVFFDVTPQEFEQHLQFIKQQGFTPISYDQLVIHLRTGLPLPEKPIMLTFDDGYGGHYEYVYPLLKKYGYPAVFSIYTSGVGNNVGRSHVSWEQLKEMAADPLITVAAHSVTHPEDLRRLSDDKLQMEVTKSKQILENKLDIPIRYFTYPAGKYNQKVAAAVKKAGYLSALTMNDNDERFAGDSESLLAIDRFGQSNLARAIANPESSILSQTSGGMKIPKWGEEFDFSANVTVNKTTIDRTYLLLISGGRPMTIHAKSRYQVPEILADTAAVAGVDGGFFSLKVINSNIMIGPVLSQKASNFVPGNASENLRLAGRPLVLIGTQAVKYIPFDPFLHNTLEGIQAEMSDVTDAFVAAAWLVKDGQPRSRESFGNLFGFDAARRRAFWGINQAGQPTIGVAPRNVDAVRLGAVLAKAGLRDAVMLDSGDSSSLAYKGELLVPYTPRPVPHVVALLPPEGNEKASCLVVNAK
ncbi:polysaccharide deacetylase family protein [Chroococcidiopsidales cyanobacterium LEGE 13417]|nr:polysaccharide deacetylase family protein [Chroococcidiopsidales cyanobacterium LEGE 13417]